MWSCAAPAIPDYASARESLGRAADPEPTHRDWLAPALGYEPSRLMLGTELRHLAAGHHVHCARCGRWVGPSDPGWLPDEKGGVECSLCVVGTDLGPGVIYPCRVEEDDDE